MRKYTLGFYVGSGGFKVFHPMVFQRAIESLHMVPEYERSKLYVHMYVYNYQCIRM